MTEEEKKFYLESGIKVGLVLWGVHKLTTMSWNPFTDPGRTDRVKFNYSKTQEQCYVIGSDNQGNQQIHCESDPWLPNDIANKAHTVFNGIKLGHEDHINIYNEIAALGIDRRKWLHNYWLDIIDQGTTLYRWIEDEYVGLDPIWPVEHPEERAAKNNVQARLAEAGIAW